MCLYRPMSAYVGIGGHIGYVLAYVDIGALCEGRFVYVVVSTCSLWAGGEGGGHAPTRPTRTHIDQHHPTRTSAPQFTEAYVSALLSYPQHTCLPPVPMYTHEPMPAWYSPLYLFYSTFSMVSMRVVLLYLDTRAVVSTRS
jgi:hypothetical protein